MLLQATTVLTQAANTSAEELVEQTTELTMQLATITEPDTVPLLPSSLNTTNQVLTDILDVLEEAENSTMEANEVCGLFGLDSFVSVQIQSSAIPHSAACC